MGAEKYANKALGFVSAIFEGGGISAISHAKGDYGGASYGKPQFALNTGSLKSFVDSLKAKAPEIYAVLSKAVLGSAEFDKAWLAVCKKYPQKFEALQDERVKANFYEPARKGILEKVGIDIDKHHRALQEALWSTAVQFGSAGAISVFRNALGDYAEFCKKHMDDKAILEAVYAEKSRVEVWFRGCSEVIQQSVKSRFVRELKLLLAFF